MMNIHPRIRCARRNAVQARRGMAMLLVLISLGTATILTMAYVASRDNSIEIGTNVADSATARWSAMAGLELGVAVLETESDWRTNHVNGVMLDDHPIGVAMVDLLIEDLETGAPPTETTNDVRLTSIATVDNVTQTASATAHISDPEHGGIDVDLSEFAVFVGSDAVIEGDATITRWPTAPSSELGRRIAIGTNAEASGTITFNGNGVAIDASVYHGAGASASLVLNTNSPPLQLEGLLGNIPLPAAPEFPAPRPEVGGEAEDSIDKLEIDTDTTLDASGAYEEIRVTDATAVLSVKGDVTLAVAGNLELANQTGMIIDGNLTLVIYDDFKMGNYSFIELLPGATLHVHIGDELIISNAYIGDERADRSVRDSTGTAPYMDPNRVYLFGSSNSATWGMRNQSVIKGNLYIPASRLNVREQSAIYGRVAANKLSLTGTASIFYDHWLNSDGGYTNPDSLLFNEDGTIKTEVQSLASLDGSALQNLADALTAPIADVDGGLLGPLLGGGDDDDVVLGPTDPTPRTVAVQVEFRQHGSDSRSWERNADGSIVLRFGDGSSNSEVEVTIPGPVTMNH